MSETHTPDLLAAAVADRDAWKRLALTLRPFDVEETPLKSVATNIGFLATWTARPPDNLPRLLTTQIARLSPPDRAAARLLAAALGVPLDPPQPAAAADPPAAPDPLLPVRFQVGTRVAKVGDDARDDYRFVGVVVADFLKRSGVRRVVAENTDGLLVVFHPDQLTETSGV